MSLRLNKHLRLDEDAIQSPNLATKFSKEDLTSIGNVCFEGYLRDIQSRIPWFKRTEAAMDLAMQVMVEKTFPWSGASNVVFPLVTIASLQFHARAYPNIIPGPNVVRCRIPMGATQETLSRADRVSRLMSYQRMEEDAPWEEGHDRMLLNLSIVGCAFKKSFHDATKGFNVSSLVLARDLVVNYKAKSIEDARRKTHVVELWRNTIWERCASGAYRDVREEAWFKATPTLVEREGSQAERRTGQVPSDTPDEVTPFQGLEQHCWLDLDGDGYDEPYIVTIEAQSREVLRIVSRVARSEDILRDARGRVVSIRAEEYFTKYGFIPAPDGGIYDIGFGVLLGPLNESVNTLINQLIDAGTMSITGGGFLGRGAKIRGGTYSFTPFEWKRVDSTGDDLRKNIVPLEVREPSNVLFQLLGLLIDYVNKIGAAGEMAAGENPGQNTKVGTANAMVEQGMKIYSAIYKRIWRSMKEEFKKLYVLNAVHLPSRKTMWNGLVAQREDFLDDPNHIVPYADPNIVSDQMRVSQAEALANRAYTIPGYNIEAVERNLLDALRVDAPERFYLGPQKAPPLPNPKMMVEQEKTRRKEMELKHQAETVVFEMQEQHSLNEAKIQQLEAQATKLLAESKGVDVTLQINAINASVGALREHNATLNDRAETMLKALTHESGDHSGAISHLVGRPSNQGGAQPLLSGPGGGQGAMGAGGSAA